MSSVRTEAEHSARGSLVINRGVTIIGDIFFDGQIVVEGSIDGEVRCSALRICERGAVEGLIVADKVIVLGEVGGSIYAGELILKAACSVEGQLYHGELVLEDGCYFEGQSRHYDNPLDIAPGPQEPASEIDSLQDRHQESLADVVGLHGSRV